MNKRVLGFVFAVFVMIPSMSFAEDMLEEFVFDDGVAKLSRLTKDGEYVSYLLLPSKPLSFKYGNPEVQLRKMTEEERGKAEVVFDDRKKLILRYENVYQLVSSESELEE